MRSSSAVLRVTAALALMLAMLTGVFGFTAAGLNQAAAQTGFEEIVLDVPETVAPGAPFSVPGEIINNTFDFEVGTITAGLFFNDGCTVPVEGVTVTASPDPEDPENANAFTLGGTAPAEGTYYLLAATTLTAPATGGEDGTPAATPVVTLSTCVPLTVAAPAPEPVDGEVSLELATCTVDGTEAGASGAFIGEFSVEVAQLCRAGNEAALTFSVYDAVTGEAVGDPVTVPAGSAGSVVIPFTATPGSFYVYEATYDATSETFSYTGEGSPSASGYFLETIVTAPTPTATPETPTATPETPTATPETPTATPETPTATPTETPVGGTIAPDLVTTVGIICEDEDLAGQYLYLIDAVAAEEMELNCRPAGEGEHTYFTARSSDASTIDEASTDENGTATLDGLYDESFFLYEDGDFNVPYGSDNIFVPSEGDGVIITPAQVGGVTVVVVEFVEPGASPSPSASPSETPSASPSEVPGTPSAMPSEEPTAGPSEAPTAEPSAAGGEVTQLPDTGAGSTSSNAGLTFGLIGLVLAAAVAGVVLGLRKRTA